MNKYTVHKSGIIDISFIEVNGIPLIGLRSFVNEDLAKEIASALQFAYNNGIEEANRNILKNLEKSYAYNAEGCVTSHAPPHNHKTEIWNLPKSQAEVVVKLLNENLAAYQEKLEKLEKLEKVAELAKTYMQSAGDRDSDKQFKALKDALDDLEEKKTFYVEVREVWVNTREVVAKNAEEAKRIAACGGGTDLPSVDLEYSHTLPSDGWTVEEKKKHY